MSPPSLRCIRCSREPGGALGEGCRYCAADGVPANLATVYDLDVARPGLLVALDGDLRGIGRYAALLPVTADEIAAPDTGDTPLVEAPGLATAARVRRVWVKDESRGPTWSFKDRAAAVAATHARALGSKGLVVASTGNAAAATAAHARRAGLPAVILFARGTDPIMAAFARAYGAHVAVTPTKVDRWALMRYCVHELGLYPNSNYSVPPIGNNPCAIDGYKTIGYEIWEQLGRRLPDAVFFSVGYGDGLFGTARAFDDLRTMGLSGAGPRVCGGEIYGSLERALTTGAERVEEARVDHPTAALSISTPQSTYQALRAVRDSAGWISRIAEDELTASQRLLAEKAGFFVETAAAAALAALLRQREDGRIAPDAEVVLVSSSSGLKSISREDGVEESPLIVSPAELAEALEPLLGVPPATTRRSS